MNCICGSKTHSRTNHLDCKLNKKIELNTAFCLSPTTSVLNSITSINLNSPNSPNKRRAPPLINSKATKQLLYCSNVTESSDKLTNKNVNSKTTNESKSKVCVSC